MRRQLHLGRLAEVPFYRNRSADITSHREFFERRNAFQRPRSPDFRVGFRSPLPCDAVAIVGVPLAAKRGVRVYPAESWQRLHLSGVKLLAATPAVLRQVVACVEAKLMALPKLEDAIVVLNTLEGGTLFPGEREVLWRCFGLPVFEQWLGLDGELLAWECAAHQGMHLNMDAMDLDHASGQLIVTSFLAQKRVTHRLATGWQGDIETRDCVCGHESPRLCNLRAASSISNLREAVAIA